MNRSVLQTEILPDTLSAEWKRVVGLSERDLSDWQDLTVRALEPNVFLELAFAMAAAKMPGQNPGAVLVREGSRLIGLFPGEVEGIANGRAVNTFVMWTHPFAPLGTPLVDAKHARDAVDTFLKFLPSIHASPRLALFPLLNESGEFARVMGEALSASNRSVRRFSAHDRAAFSPLMRDAPALSAKKTKELRRQRRRLEEMGELNHKPVTEPEDISAALSEYVSLEAKGWKGRKGSAAQSHSDTEEFMRSAVSGLGGKGQARIDFLRLNDVPIAAAITLFSGSEAWFWKISYDEDFARHSPGVLLALDLTEDLLKQTNLALVDSCAAANHPMIDHLWARRIRIADWLVPLSGQASFAAGIVFETARRMSVAGLKATRGLIR